MPLAIGSRIGPYELTGVLGAGGMGEVYRARDTKLNRDVALKVLPDALAGDQDRLARFRREAQVLASLNHPNIAHIHGFEDSQSTASPGTAASSSFAIVMELVEGPTLADLIAAGSSAPAPVAPGESASRGATTSGGGASRALSLDDALPIARQIADALEAAHEQGIIHRDLKPANIKVRDDGTVKVLDFGLAKALDPTDPSGAASVSNSPTLTARATQLGMILGTAAYMAPEQARGRPVDRRADIWAFGVVLYEMLTGRRAFEGDDVSITLASVLKEDVKWDALPADLPASIRRLLRRCLEKDPKRRLSAIGDARLELDDATDMPETAPAAAPPSGIGTRERLLWMSLAGLAIVAAAVFGLRSGPEPEAPPPMARFGVLPPGDAAFSGAVPRFAVSPDGQSLVFSTADRSAQPEQLWLRRLDSLDVRAIPGTASAPGALAPQFPFFSPDGQHLAFFVQTEGESARGESRLRTVNLQGGSVRSVAALPGSNAGGSWNADGVILVSTQGTKGVQRIPASGGVAVQVTTLDEASQEVAHLFPQFLPDGKRFIYQVRTTDRAGWSTFLGSIDTPERTKLVDAEYARFAAPNLLLYVKDDDLLAQRVDLSTATLTGEPVLAGTGVASLSSNGRAAFSVSDTGVLVVSSNPDAEQQRTGAADRQLVWVDRNGTTVETIKTPTSAWRLRLSADGRRVALLEFAPNRTALTNGALWVLDLDRQVKTPLTTTPVLAFSPVWSADDTRVLFGALAEGSTVVRLTDRVANGATPARMLLDEPDRNVVPLDVSADGAHLVVAAGEVGARGLYVMSTATGQITAYLSGGLDYSQASLSRDGRWLAYVSDEGGTRDVIVQPFPDASRGKWKISANGGTHPRWRRDGRELFYVDADQRLVAVAVSSNREFEPGRTTTLFELPGVAGSRLVGSAAYPYDVSPDGQRFLVSRGAAGASVTPLTVVTNWTSLLNLKK